MVLAPTPLTRQVEYTSEYLVGKIGAKHIEGRHHFRLEHCLGQHVSQRIGPFGIAA
jgi:hypothetical protein